MSSPSASWHRNILELEPVTLLKPPPTLDRIMQPWSPKNLRWVVVHDHTVVTGGDSISSHLRCFKPSWHPPQFYPVIIILFASFSSKTPNAWTKQVRKKPRFLSCHIAVSFFFDHHDIPQWSKQQDRSKLPFLQASFKRSLCSRCGRLTVSLVLCEASDKISTTAILQKQSGWIVDGVSRYDRSES